MQIQGTCFRLIRLLKFNIPFYLNNNPLSTNRYVPYCSVHSASHEITEGEEVREGCQNRQTTSWNDGTNFIFIDTQ